MRVLFVPFSWPSHYYPMVPLAWAFRSGGHEVRVASQPAVVDAIVGSGLPAVSVGAAYNVMSGIAELNSLVIQANGRMPTSVEGMRSLPTDILRKYGEMRIVPHLRAATAMADELAAFAQAWRPNLLVSDPVTLVAPLVADSLDIPLVHHLWGPHMAGLATFPGLGEPVDHWPAELRELFERFQSNPRVRYAVRTIDPCPASLQVSGVPGRMPVQYVPYNGCGTVPAWLNEPSEKPRVCISWSITNTQATGEAGFHLREIINAIAKMNVEIVVAVHASDHSSVEQIAGDVRVVRGLPLQFILPTCLAHVHHGGAGTMLTAASYGIPQVMVTPMPDQTFNSERLTAAGAGIAFRADEVTVNDIAAAVSSALSNDSLRKAARELQEEILSQPTPSEVVNTLERMFP